MTAKSNAERLEQIRERARRMFRGEDQDNLVYVLAKYDELARLAKALADADWWYDESEKVTEARRALRRHLQENSHEPR